MIVVTGATGQVGGRLVALLSEQGQQIRAMVQPGVEPSWPPEVEADVVIADFRDAEAVSGALHGADRVFLLVPPHPSQVDWQRTIIGAAKDAEYVVKLSAFDSAADSTLTMGRWHHQGEQDLQHSGIPHAILRPQYFLQNLLHDAQAIARGVLTTFIPSGRAVGMVDAADVAAVAAALLCAAAPPAQGQVFIPTGPAAVTVAKLTAELSKALAHPVHETYLNPDEARAVLTGRGLPPWHIADTITTCQTASPKITDDVERLTGSAARSLTAVAESFADAHRS